LGASLYQWSNRRGTLAFKPIGSPVDMSTGRRRDLRSVVPSSIRRGCPARSQVRSPSRWARDAASARARGAEVFGGPFGAPATYWNPARPLLTFGRPACSVPMRQRVGGTGSMRLSTYRFLRLPPAGSARTRHTRREVNRASCSADLSGWRESYIALAKPKKALSFSVVLSGAVLDGSSPSGLPPAPRP